MHIPASATSGTCGLCFVSACIIFEEKKVFFHPDAVKQGCTTQHSRKTASTKYFSAGNMLTLLLFERDYFPIFFSKQTLESFLKIEFSKVLVSLFLAF